MVDSEFFEKIKHILSDVWDIASFQASYSDYEFFIFLWVILLYIFILFFILYIFKELVNLIVKFSINPITLLFLLLFLALAVWTITKVDNYEIKNTLIDADNSSINLLPEKVKIEELKNIEDDKDQNSRDFDDIYNSLHMQLVSILKQGRSTKIAAKSRVRGVEV